MCRKIIMFARASGKTLFDRYFFEELVNSFDFIEQSIKDRIISLYDIDEIMARDILRVHIEKNAKTIRR